MGYDSEIQQQKAALWALGNICATPLGLDMALKEDSNLLKRFVWIAEQHSNLSLRGIAFQVINLLGQTSNGKKYILKMGWESRASLQSRKGCQILLPKDVHRLCQSINNVKEISIIPEHVVEDDELKLQNENRVSRETGKSISTDDIPRESEDLGNENELIIEEEILKNIMKLNSSLDKKEGQAALNKLRKNPKVRKLFTSLRFYARVFGMVSKYHFKLSSRRMISQLFNSLDCSKEAWDIFDSENDKFQLPTECLDYYNSSSLSN